MKHNFRELEIWQEGVKVAELIYLKTNDFPKAELYGLTSQIRRAAVSIPSNIAEGCGRGTDAQVVHFLDIALGSAGELETQLVIARRLGFLATEPLNDFTERLNSLQRRIRAFREKIVTNTHFLKTKN